MVTTEYASMSESQWDERPRGRKEGAETRSDEGMDDPDAEEDGDSKMQPGGQGDSGSSPNRDWQRDSRDDSETNQNKQWQDTGQGDQNADQGTGVAAGMQNLQGEQTGRYGQSSPSHGRIRGIRDLETNESVKISSRGGKGKRSGASRARKHAEDPET
jgi:hypothetical protein